MKTPIQELITLMVDQRRIMIDVNAGLSRPSETTQTQIEMLTDCIRWAKSMLEIEREKIVSSYKQGVEDGMFLSIRDYYNETFNTNEK